MPDRTKPIGGLTEEDVALFDHFKSLSPSDQIDLLRSTEAITPERIKELRSSRAIDIDDIELQHYRRRLEFRHQVSVLVFYMIYAFLGIAGVLLLWEIFTQGDVVGKLKSVFDMVSTVLNP